jgi:hypothetical protein
LPPYPAQPIAPGGQPGQGLPGGGGQPPELPPGYFLVWIPGHGWAAAPVNPGQLPGGGAHPDNTLPGQQPGQGQPPQAGQLPGQPPQPGQQPPQPSQQPQPTPQPKR